MGYCKLECPDGETECCICCTKNDSCQCKCDDMDRTPADVPFVQLREPVTSTPTSACIFAKTTFASVVPLA